MGYVIEMSDVELSPISERDEQEEVEVIEPAPEPEEEVGGGESADADPEPKEEPLEPLPAFNEDGRGIPVAFKMSPDGEMVMVYYDKKAPLPDSEEFDRTLLESIYGKRATRTKPQRIELSRKIDKLIDEDKLPESMLHLYDISKEYAKGSRLFPIPASRVGLRLRDCVTMPGRSGLGKSTSASKLIKTSRVLNTVLGGEPIKNVFVLTAQPDDAKFAPCTYVDIDDYVIDEYAEYQEKKREWDEIKGKMLHLKPMLMKRNPDKYLEMETLMNSKKPIRPTKKSFRMKKGDEQLEDFRDSIFLMDDFEDKEDLDKINFLKGNLLNRSRHYKCVLMFCVHKIQDGKRESTHAKRESSSFVFFSGDSWTVIRYTLVNELGLNEYAVRRIRKMLKTSHSVFIDRDTHIVVSDNAIIAFE